MGWLRIDDMFARHPKVLAAGPLGLALHVAGMCYCSQYLTDGFVSNAVTNTLLDWSKIALFDIEAKNDLDFTSTATPVESQVIVTRLVESGIWQAVDGGYQIHDYLDYNPSREQVQVKQAANAARQQRHKERANNGVSNAVSNASGNAVSNAVSNGTPHPLPLVKEKESSYELSQKKADSKSKPPTDPLIMARFDEFWAAYPKKVGKKDARAAWEKIAPDAERFAAIMAGLAAWKASAQWQNPVMVKDPSGWLNGEHWEDAPPVPTNIAASAKYVNPLSAFIPDDMPDAHGKGRVIL